MTPPSELREVEQLGQSSTATRDKDIGRLQDSEPEDLCTIHEQMWGAWTLTGGSGFFYQPGQSAHTSRVPGAVRGGEGWPPPPDGSSFRVQ